MGAGPYKVTGNRADQCRWGGEAHPGALDFRCDRLLFFPEGGKDLVYKGVLFATQAMELIAAVAKAVHTGATLANTSATAAETAAQWGLKSALLACPLTWIVVGIMLVIAVIIVLTLWFVNLWNTNVDFKVGVIRVWNDILGFFDQVPIFFMGVGYGIADAFSYAKTMSMLILQELVNGAIARINWLIEKVNHLPGVAIGAIEGVTFGAETAVEEEAQRAQRAANLSGAKAQAAAKAADRQQALAEDENQWRAQAAAQEQAETQQNTLDSATAFDEYDFPPVELSGWKLDKVGSIGKEVDLSDQTLAYFNDIAEMQALEDVNAYAYTQIMTRRGRVRSKPSIPPLPRYKRSIWRQGFRHTITNDS